MNNLELSVLSILQKNHRTSVSEIARILSVSPSTIRHAIKTLETKTIQDYTISINPNHLGSHRAIVLRLKTNPRESKIAQILQDHPLCQSLFGITGEYSLLGIFHFYSPQQFKLLIELIEPLLSTTTNKRYQVTDLMTTYKNQGIPTVISKHKVADTLDALDFQILSMLQNQGCHRQSTMELAQKLQKPQPTIYRRIKKLHQNNTITRFSVSLRIDSYPIQVYLQLKVSPRDLESTIKGLVNHPRILDLYRTSEEFALLAHVGVHSISELNSILVSLYTENTLIVDTHTIFLLNTFKHQPIPVPHVFP